MKWAKGWCNRNTGLLVLRVCVGLFFMGHGVVKLQDMAGVSAFFASLGFPAFLAWFVAFAELIGGAALVLGVFVCWAGGLLAVIQAVAIFKVTGRIPAESFVTSFAFGWGMNLVLIGTALGIAWAGPGRYAVWGGRCSGWCLTAGGCDDCDTCTSCPECGTDPGGNGGGETAAEGQ